MLNVAERTHKYCWKLACKKGMHFKTKQTKNVVRIGDTENKNQTCTVNIANSPSHRNEIHFPSNSVTYCGKSNFSATKCYILWIILEKSKFHLFI